MGFHIDELYVPCSKKTFNRHIRSFHMKHDGRINEVSRKTKKFMLGRKWGKASLKQRIKSVVVTANKYPQEADLSDVFCPKCGCERERSTGNMTSYPERWVRVYCMRCGYRVAESDNSPFVHVLELMRGEDASEFDPKYW